MQREEEDFGARERIVVVNHSGSTATLHIAELARWIRLSIPYCVVFAILCAIVVGVYFGFMREESIRVKASLNTATWTTVESGKSSAVFPIGILARDLGTSGRYQKIWLEAEFSRPPAFESQPPVVAIEAFDNGWIGLEVVVPVSQEETAKQAVSFLISRILVIESNTVDRETIIIRKQVEMLEDFWTRATEAIGIENNPLVELSREIVNLEMKIESIQPAAVQESVTVTSVSDYSWWIYSLAVFLLVLVGTVGSVALLYLVGSSR